ncbi:MAG: sulfite reductase subunit C [Bilifractor sp.]|nr:sulfite reductase subunit C [Lachnospiraceae bacterium]MDY2836605.1 sulfite reductase subunit C [Bilifractor sp.]
MGYDCNVKKLKKNNFRQSKVRGEVASRVRVPGGRIDAASLAKVVEIAVKYGTGEVNLTNRQGFEIPGIPIEDVEEVNKALQSIIEASGVTQEPNKPGEGYPSSGTRNVVACPGKSLCPFGCYDTKALAAKIDKLIYPNDHHVKIACTGCSNDCAHVRLNDFGIIGQTEPQYNPDRCIGCEQCVKYCSRRSVGALSVVNGKIVRDTSKCIGCGVCVVYCPTRAWTRSKEHYFRVALLGRTGKKNPRLGVDFLKWADEESILRIIKNTYDYLDAYQDRGAVENKEHIGYIVDRTGFEEFLKYIMKDVHFGPKTEMNGRPYWGGKRYDQTNELRSSMYRFSDRPYDGYSGIPREDQPPKKR